MSKATQNAKVVKNLYGDYRYFQGNMYSIEVAHDSWICVDWFSTKRGAAFALALYNMGITEDQLNFIDCDDIARCVVNSNPPSQRKAAMAAAVQARFDALKSN